MDLEISGNVLVKHINYKDCEKCDMVERLFTENQMQFATIICDKRMFGSISKKSKSMDVPQVFVNGEFIGGHDEFSKLIDNL
jgi:glutaredoxin